MPPQVVTDQVRLWEKELSRLQAQTATLYERFESAELYEGAVQHARQLGALLYHSDDKRQLAVASASHDAMRAHLRERKAALGL
jgi:transcription initiation factor TFIIH subunit 4